MELDHSTYDYSGFFKTEQIVAQVLVPGTAYYIKRKSNRLAITLFFFIIALLCGGLAGLALGSDFLSDSDEAGPIFFFSALFFLIISLTFFFIALATRKPARIKRLSLLAIPIQHSKFQDKSVLVDKSGLLKPVGFSYPSLDEENVKKLDSTFKNTRQLVTKIPMVLSPKNQYRFENQTDKNFKNKLELYAEEARCNQFIENITQIFDSVHTFDVQLPLFDGSNRLLDFLKQNNLNSNSWNGHVLQKISDIELRGKIEGIVGIVHTSKSQAAVDVDDLALDILAFYDKLFPRLDYVLNKSLHHINVQYINQYLENLTHSSYNYYCPHCNQEAINSLLHNSYGHDGAKDFRVNLNRQALMIPTDPFTFVWRCRLCERETKNPFQIHKMIDELFTPVYDMLYEENLKDRLQIYNHINDEKRSYTEKAQVQFHEVMRDNRNKTDTIKSKIRSILAEIKADESAIFGLRDLLTKFDRISTQKIREIDTEMQHIKMEMEDKARAASESLNDVVQNAKNSISSSIEKYSNLARQDQAQRDKLQKKMAQTHDVLLKLQQSDSKRAEMDSQAFRQYLKRISRFR